MKMKVVAGLAFLLNTLFYGSYYSIAKGALGHIDPIVFTFLTMMTLIPPALIIIIWSWRNMTRQAVKSGFLLGSCLCLGLFTLAVALKYNSATGTAFFPSLNGLLAAIFTWYFLRQPIAQGTWFGGIVSVTGAVLLMLNASIGGARGALIAFIGGLLCTGYIFLADHEQKEQTADWPLLGVELLTMSMWASLIVLLFGDWQGLRFALPNDLLSILYIGLGTIFVPTLFTVLFQKHIAAITVSFICILEPILGAVVAFLYLHEVLPLDGYLGGFLVVAGVLIHTWGTIERPRPQRVGRQQLAAARIFWSPWSRALFYPLLCCVVGLCVTYVFGGFPPPVWLSLFMIIPRFPALFQAGSGLQACLLLAQSFSWVLAWVALIAMGGLALYRTLGNLLLLRPAAPLLLEHNAPSLRQTSYSSRPEHSPHIQDQEYYVKRSPRHVQLELLQHDDETGAWGSLLRSPHLYSNNDQQESFLNVYQD